MILLLVIITRHSRLEAATLATEQAARQLQNAKLEEEELQWQIGIMDESRSKTESQLADKRNQLASIEEHLRRLQDEWSRLAQRAKGIDEHDTTSHVQSSTLQAELDRVRKEIAQAELELDRARSESPGAPTSYAIVPYTGPNGTRRKPMYVECLRDRIILQPEGIVFGESDFDGHAGPGNPLAAAIRAGRDHLVSRAEGSPTSAGDPYPLLLVRPDGVPAYNVARVALSSWGSDFGYEFVDADWKLAFPQVDAELAEVERRAAEAARSQITQRGPAASGLYARKSRPVYRAAVTGGITRERGGSGEESRAFSTQTASNHSSSARPGGSEREIGSSALNEKQNYEQNVGSDSKTIGEAPSSEGPAGPQQAVRSSTPNAGQSAIRPESLAKRRGRDWSLPAESSHAVPIRRPIRVQCRSDQLVLLPDKGATGGSSIALGPQTADAVDELVRAVRAHTKGWGIAGSGMYWRPELVLEIGPGGQTRFDDLQSLLESSGLELRQGE
jgi:hypothetical protein